MTMATILGLIEPEIVPFDVPTPTHDPRTKHEVYQMTCCRDMAIWNSTFDEGCIWDHYFRV